MLRRSALSLCLVASASLWARLRASVALAQAPLTRRLEVRALAASPPLEGPVLALAPLAGDRLAVLGLDGVRLYRWSGGELARLGGQALPGLEPVRHPAGLLLGTSDTLWVLRSGAPRAVLLGMAPAGTLSVRLEAEAIPWPGCPRGLRYRAGTDLLEGLAEGLGEGPFLAVANAVAVDADGRLLVGSPEGAQPSALRAGTALVGLGNGLLAAASAAPPGPSDTILFLEHEAGELRVLEEVAVAGSVRALASAAGPPGTTRLLAALASGDVVKLATFHVRRAGP